MKERFKPHEESCYFNLAFFFDHRLRRTRPLKTEDDLINLLRQLPVSALLSAFAANVSSAQQQQQNLACTNGDCLEFDTFDAVDSTEDRLRVELRLFVAQSMPVPTTFKELGNCLPCYEWWRRHGVNYPMLRLAAQCVFSVPASCSEIERFFSTAGYHDAAHKAAQTANTLRVKTLLSRNYRYAYQCGRLPWKWATGIKN